MPCEAFGCRLRILKPVDTAAALASGSAPRPLLPQPRPRAPRLILGSAHAASKPPASPPVALPRLRICAPTRLQVQAAARRRGGDLLHARALRHGGRRRNGALTLSLPLPLTLTLTLALALALTLTPSAGARLVVEWG